MISGLTYLKRQLNIESGTSFTDDDGVLQYYLDIAEQSVNNYCGIDALTGYTDSTMPVSVNQAIILLATHFYLNRNMVGFGNGAEIPYSFKFLLDPYKNYIVV